MKKKNSLLEQVNIQELESRYNGTTNWLMDNVLSPVRLWDEVCNERAILGIRIYTYYQKNLA
jgi:hypothetical protein